MSDVPTALHPQFKETGMGLDVSLWYADQSGGNSCRVEVYSNYESLGSIDGSVKFWGNPRIREIGIQRLAKLGKWSPIVIEGWDGLDQLGRELATLAEHLPTINYDPRAKASWLAILTHCYQYLRAIAPKDSVPSIMIG